MSEHRVELQGVTKRFGDFTALAPLDLTVRHGQFIVLLGPAGSGKTTALRLIAGLERPTAGTVLIDGLDVTPLPPQRRDVAFVFQSPALYPHMTVERNLAYPMRAQSIPRNVITRRVSEVIERLGLDALRRRKRRKLSLPQQQLVSIGRAIVRDAKAFLFDEPLAPFEGAQREHMRRELRAIHEELRGTTIFATRDPADAIALADRLAVVNEGRIVQFDAPRTVVDQPADLFVARLTAPAGTHFFDATMTDGTAKLNACGLAFRVDDHGARPVDEAKLTLAVAPQHLRLDADGKPLSVDPTTCRWFDATSGKALPWRTIG